LWMLLRGIGCSKCSTEYYRNKTGDVGLGVVLLPGRKAL